MANNHVVLPCLQSGLIRRAIAASVLVIFIVGSIITGISAYTESKQFELRYKKEIQNLLELVTPIVLRVIKSQDVETAKSVVMGLLKNGNIIQATIQSGNAILADESKKNIASPQYRLTNTQVESWPLVSAENSHAAEGEIRLYVLPVEQAIGYGEILTAKALALSWQLLLLGSSVFLVLMFWLARPIIHIARQIRHLDLAAGDQVIVPPGHKHTEVGILTKEINELASELVEAIDQEHSLRLQREIDERKYHAIFDNAESGIVIFDGSGAILSWNPAFSRLLGIAPMDHQVIPPSIGESAWEDSRQIDELILRCLQESAPVADELAVLTAEGTTSWLSVILSPIGDGLLQGVVHDVSSFKEAEASARLQAVTDSLTGLSNRSGLEARLQSLISTENIHQVGYFALLLVNVDKFRLIVEGHGLPVSDELLKTLAHRLTAAIKGDDTIARLSSDIFCLLLPNLTEGDMVRKVVDRLTQAINQPFYVDGSHIHLKASIGVTLFPDDGGNFPTLLRNAELAVDRAKQAGGNTAVYFDSTFAVDADNRRQLEIDLRSAIRDGNFVLYYQPIIDLRNNCLVGAEALIRWRHPVRGIIEPDQFIPVAEQAGLINEIGLWVVQNACRQLQNWNDRGFKYTLSLNVSGRQIPDGLPPETVAATLAEYHILPRQLALEITEGVLLKDVDQSLRWLTAMHAIGVRIHMDDFGTGYSSLAYLKRFPVETLKMDKSFVMDMHRNHNDQPLVQSIVAMAHNLGMKVVAEGVEAGSHVELLRAMDCHFAQGYYFSHPLPVAEFEVAASRITQLSALGTPTLQ